MPNFLDAPEILPLPSLQTYSSISFLLLSCSLYYAFQITSEPDWKSNSSYVLPDIAFMGDVGNNDTLLNSTILNETLSRNNFFATFFDEQNDYVIFNDLFENQNFLRLIDVAYIMVHEPLCVWTLINMGYCLLILFGKVIQKVVFGDLRVSEQQLLRDRFWNFLLYKFIFVFSVINVQYIDELVLWCAWFSVLGFMFLLTHLCKERFNYLNFSPTVSKWVHFRLLSLLVFILISTIPLFVTGVIVALHTSFNIGVFLISECCLIFLRTLYCVILYCVHLWDLTRDIIWERRASINYYIELIFDFMILFIDFSHHLHMLFWGNIILSVSSLVILIQLRSIFGDIQRRVKKHKNYLHVLRLMEENFPIATEDELNQNNDDCAICWDHMNTARKLPCGHFFHITCLRSWLEQDTSCPTCRHSLRQREEETNEVNSDTEGIEAIPGRVLFGNNNARFTNHFFHFDGSRYARWLPTVSVEVSRSSMMDLNPSIVRNEIHQESVQQQIEYMGQQVLEWFPQVSMSSILDDLLITRSVEHTIENILDGRLRESTSAGFNSQSAQVSTNPTSSNATAETEARVVEVSETVDVVEGSSGSSGIAETNSNLENEIKAGTSSSSSANCQPNNDQPKVSDNDRNSDNDDIDLTNRFLQLTPDERKSLLAKRKEKLFNKAKLKYLQNPS